MRIDNQFEIKPHSSGWKLIESKVGKSKDGKEVVRKKSYYFPTFQVALDAYLDKSIAKCQSIIEVSNQIADLKQLIYAIDEDAFMHEANFK